MNKIKQIVQDLAQQLMPIYEHQATATDNAWWIIQAITKLSKTELLIKKDISLFPEQKTTLAQWVQKLVHEHMPLQYLLGTVPFLDLQIQVKPPILIPRPETEEWVANLIKNLKEKNQQPRTILDLCTGSGCIALALAHAFPKSSVSAADINPEALTLAQENAQKNQIKKIKFIESDLFEKIPPQRFDLIVSNPPYIDEKEWEQLAPEVKLWEDRGALVAPVKGLGLIALIVEQAADFLAPAGHLSIEIGHKQGPQVNELFKKRGFKEVETVQDLHGKDRVVKGIWKQF